MQPKHTDGHARVKPTGRSERLVLGLLALLCPAAGRAWAADLVIHDGSADAAFQQLTTVGVRDAAHLLPTTIDGLTGGVSRPLLVGAPLLVCPGVPLRNDALRSAVAEADLQFKAAEFGKTAQVVDGALASLPCLTEPVQAAAVARLHLLYGLVALRSGDPEAAARAFRRAVLYEPGLRWDPALPPEAGQKTFDAALRESGGDPVALLVGPGFPPGTQFLLDGQVQPDARTIGVMPGDHLLQIQAEGGLTTIGLQVGTEPMLLVVPTALDGAWLERMPQPEVAQALAVLANAHRGAGENVYVVVAGRSWRLDASGLGWDELRIPLASATRERARVPAAGWVAAGGGAVALAGGALFGVSTVRGVQWMDAWADDPSEEAVARWGEARTAQQVYGAVALGGLAIAGAGVVVQLADGPLAFSPLPGAAGLVVHLQLGARGD